MNNPQEEMDDSGYDNWLPSRDLTDDSPPGNDLPDGDQPGSSLHPTEPPRWLWQGRIGPAFWTVAGLISLTVNIILVALLVLLGREIFSLKSLVDQQLIGGLYKNFIRMDEANIVTSIRVQDT
ncbi:MAG: hypothetical protein ACWGO1_03080, partial [Anaerolineales bacterium]